MNLDGELERQEFAGILRECGIWGLYTRTDRRFPCQSCYDLTTHSARPGCAKCFGTGFKARLETWLIQWTDTLRRPQDMEPEQTAAGTTTEKPTYALSSHVDIPVVGDRFYIVDWNLPWEKVPGRGRPTRLVQAFRVGFVAPFFQREVIYYISHSYYVT